MISPADQPDFGDLPQGTRRVFEQRREGLPVGRVRSGIGAEAIMLIEARFVQAMAKRLRLGDAAAQDLGTWHMRATHELLRSAGVAPYGRSGAGRRVESRSGRSLQTVLVRWHLWNFLNGTFTWIRNRTIDVRAATLKRASTHGRPPGGRTAT